MIKRIWQSLKPLLFEEAQRSETGSGSRISFYHWLLIVGCLGLAAMILHNYFSLQHEVQPASSIQMDQADRPSEAEEAEEVFGPSRSSPMREYEEFYENKLKDILTRIKGVGDVTVFVNIESTEEVVVERNRRTQQSQTNEKDREGGSRSIDDQSSDEQVVIIRTDDGEEPVVIMHKKPAVRGVMVVATGADNAQVKAWITEAVQRSLNVPLHRISVLPKK